MFVKGVREERREAGTARPRDLSSKNMQDILPCFKTESSIWGENSWEKLLTWRPLDQNGIATQCVYKLLSSPGTLSWVGKSEATQLACRWLTYRGVFFGKLSGWLHCLHWDGVHGSFYFLQHPQIHLLPTPPQQGTTQPCLIPPFQTSLDGLSWVLFDL